MISIDLQWLKFSVDLNAVEAWMKANAGPNYCGNSADADLTLWFTDEPGEEVRDNIAAYWSGLKAKSAEAKGYQSKEDRKAAADSAKAASLASANAKLKAMGLSDDEIAALRS